jgi:SAM-dependent methyltransferase
MLMEFRDLFSEQSELYARYRPRYAPAMFQWLASIATSREVALDCGTGNGQAAMGLAEQFARVVAIDASAEQISRATPHERVEYRVALSEQTGLLDASVDLVISATAVHWFDLDRFYAEVWRLLRPGGVIAVWTYQRSLIAPAIDELISMLSNDIVGKYWDPRIALVNDRYRSLPFPFEEISAPEFQSIEEWTAEQMLGYLASWSATRGYIEATGHDPLEIIRDPLQSLWPGRREVRWDLCMRVGHV